MIAKLTGRRDAIDEDSVIVDVGGVGYHVFCSARTLAALPPAGALVSLTVETHVREDHIHLYGFASTDERDWFRLLQNIQGVGARLALRLLAVLAVGELIETIASQDHARLTQANGVGAKLARRIIGELKDRVPSVGAPAATAAVAALGGPTGDAVSALVNLGYGRSEAFGAVAAAQRDLGHEAGIEALIRGGLRELAG